MGHSKAAMLAGSALLAGLVTISAKPARAETLGEAIADAYRTNPRLQAQRAQLRALDESVILAASPYRLTLGLGGSVQYSNQQFRAPNGEFDTFVGKSIGAALNASQILLNGGRTAAQVSAAEAEVLAGREALRETENFLLLEVVDAYVSVRRDQEVVAIQERSVDSYSRQVEQARARERGGDLTRTDIAQAEAQLQIIRSQLAAARATLENSRSRFAVAVGRNPGQLDVEPPLPGLPPSVDEAYRIAETESPTLFQAVLNERAGKSRVAAARAERNPQLTASGSFGYVNDSTYRLRDAGRGYSGGLTLTVPILSSGVNEARIRQAVAGRQQLTFLIEDTRRTVDAALLNAWNQSISARDQLSAGQAAVNAAEAALTGVRRGFAEGFRSNFEVLDSEQRLLNAQLIVASARYARYAGQASLLANLGRLEAALIGQEVAAYDKRENLRRQRNGQIGPFQVVLQPIDQLQRPSGESRAAPTIASVPNPAVRAAAVPPPEGGLATGLPVDPAMPVRPPVDRPREQLRP